MKKLILVLLVLGAVCAYLWFSDKPTTTVFLPPPTPAPVTPTPVSISVDPRIAKLQAFFTLHKCPQISFDLIPDYLNAADKNNLDYRILPAISFQESTCGQHYPAATNNLWGWDSARTGFSSIRQGLNFVAERLANGYFYKGKTLDQKLHSYNSNPSYAPSIKGLMKEIDNE